MQTYFITITGQFAHFKYTRVQAVKELILLKIGLMWLLKFTTTQTCIFLSSLPSESQNGNKRRIHRAGSRCDINWVRKSVINFVSQFTPGVTLIATPYLAELQLKSSHKL